MLFHHSIQTIRSTSSSLIQFDPDMMLRQPVNFFTLSFLLSSLDILCGSKEVIILTKGYVAGDFSFIFFTMACRKSRQAPQNSLFCLSVAIQIRMRVCQGRVSVTPIAYLSAVADENFSIEKSAQENEYSPVWKSSIRFFDTRLAQFSRSFQGE